MPNASRELSGGLEEWLRAARDLFDRGARYPYGVFLKDGTLVGHVTATPDGSGRVELGYWAHAAHVRRGYVTEAVEAVVEAFAPATFVIHCDPDNAGSAGVAARAGFVHVRTDTREGEGRTYQEMTWERVVPPRYT
jgi:RimJ/RimL family protein N-acetyltransferase